MIYYVAGLLFNSTRSRLALIRKDHGPEYVIGRWNAIGGKRQVDESPADAMRREFIEETGVSLAVWEPFLALRRAGEWEVEFFRAFDTAALAQVRTCERELVCVFDLDDLLAGIDIEESEPSLVPNLNWIIPMALERGGPRYVVEERI